MKKALVYLAFSILILGMIISYDVTKCDGQVIMKHFIKSDYEPVYEDYEPAVYEPTKEAEEAKPTAVVTVEVEKAQIEEIEQTEATEDESLVEDEQDDSVSEAEDSSRGFEYYFNHLEDDKEKKLYRSMYNAFEQVGSGNTIPTVDDETMNKIAGYIKMDHPELYYIKDMGYTHYTLGGQIQKTVIAANYTDSKTVISMELENMNAIADSVIASIPAGADDYTKVKAVYEWIILNTEYDLNAADNQNIKSVLLGKKSVCAGYARTMQFILNKAGVKTTMVEGKSLVTGENHAWNLVFADGNYYYVDPTWGDASYVGNEYQEEGKKNGINYDYLLVTTEEINRTHVIASYLPMPLCNSMDDNYYVREGLYLYGLDTTALAAMFDNAYNQGREAVSFKCANLETYDEARNYLIRNNGIFDYLHGDTNKISYVENEEQRTLCFWL